MRGHVREAVRSRLTLHDLLRTALTSSTTRSERPASRIFAPNHSLSQIRRSRRWRARPRHTARVQRDELNLVDGLIALYDGYAIGNAMEYGYALRAGVKRIIAKAERIALKASVDSACCIGTTDRDGLRATGSSRFVGKVLDPALRQPVIVRS